MTALPPPVNLGLEIIPGSRPGMYTLGRGTKRDRRFGANLHYYEALWLLRNEQSAFTLAVNKKILQGRGHETS